MIDETDMTDEAQQLIEFLLSDEAQPYFAEETFEYPLADGGRRGRRRRSTRSRKTGSTSTSWVAAWKTRELIDESGLT